MNEKIIANGITYDAENVTTSTNSISFTLNDTAENLKTAFKDVTEINVSDNDGQVYGTYEHIYFESVTEYAEDGKATVTMHIMSKTEIAITDLQTSQAEQDEAIAELYGMEA